MFFNNKAEEIGGALICDTDSSFVFKETSIVHFSNNSAALGGAILSINKCGFTLEGDSVIIFNNNNAEEGGAMHFSDNSKIILKGYM